MDFHILVDLYPPFSRTVRARAENDLPPSLTAGTGGIGDKEAPLGADGAPAATLGASLGLSAGGASASLADRTYGVSGNLDLLIGSGKSLFQADFKIIAEIRPPGFPWPRLRGMDEFFKKILEKIVDGFLAVKEIVGPGKPSPPFRSRGMPETVVGRPLLGILKDLVGLRNAFEMFFRPRIPGVFVRMILMGKATVGFLDLFGCRLGVEAKKVAVGKDVVLTPENMPETAIFRCRPGVDRIEYTPFGGF